MPQSTPKGSRGSANSARGRSPIALSAPLRLPEGVFCGIVPEGVVAIQLRPYEEKLMRSPSNGQSEFC